uniref:Uncharacterized protein n=1 Tax=Arundo donax TaxID=35708 RepID=A0A0A8ZYH3_ARUDO
MMSNRACTTISSLNMATIHKRLT